MMPGKNFSFGVGSLVALVILGSFVVFICIFFGSLWWHHYHPLACTFLFSCIPAIMSRWDYVPLLWNMRQDRGIFTFLDLDFAMLSSGFRIYPIAREEHRWTWSYMHGAIEELVDFPSYLGLVHLDLATYRTFLLDVEEASGLDGHFQDCLAPTPLYELL